MGIAGCVDDNVRLNLDGLNVLGLNRVVPLEVDNTVVVDILGPWGEFDTVSILLDSRQVDLAVLPLAPFSICHISPIEVWLDFGGFDEEHCTGI
jgi:hypothetical protein